MDEKRDPAFEFPIRGLYIDDDEALLDLTREYLETHTSRITVETTSSPRDGLDMLDDGEFDVVLCDYQMPELDGLEVLETLRREYDDDTPFIMFTGEGRKEVAIDALNLGADRYLRKGGDPTSQYGVLAQAIEQEVEHHRTRRQLRERDKNLQIVLESISDGVVTTDVDGRVTRLNSVAEDLTGWTAANAVGRPLGEVFDVVDAETREPEANRVQAVLETGEVDEVTDGHVLRHRDGSERVVSESASPMETEDGDVIGVVIVFRDVTEEYRSRRRQRRQQRTIVDISGDEDITSGDVENGAHTITETAADVLDVARVGIWLFEDDGSVLRNVDLYENATDTHESGDELSASEYPDYFDALATHRSLAVTDARTDPRTAELAAGYLEPLGITSLLDATVRSGGEVIGVICHEHTGEPRDWKNDEGRFAGELADQVLRLVSNKRRKEHEVALKELHDIATDISTYDAPEAVCQRTLDVAETILDFDRCVINLEEDGMLPITAISDALPADGATPMSVQEGIAGKTFRTGESFLFGDVRGVEAANPQGPYRSVLSIPIAEHGVFQSVSERVDAFDEDDRELAELLVSHTEQALDQLEKERELHRQNERLDEFTSVVSHDLRNPLNVAIGRLELARDECDRDYLDDVERAHDRMEKLIDDVLALAREGQSAIETESVDLRNAIDRCCRTVDTEEATVVTETDREILADRSRLQQLLQNLVRNAVKHAGPTVTITVGDAKNGFYVEDDGPGIPSEQWEKAFEKGYSTVQGGTGFGLSIVKRIADSHGWDVAITDGTSGGTRIELTGVETVEN